VRKAVARHPPRNPIRELRFARKAVPAGSTPVTMIWRCGWPRTLLTLALVVLGVSPREAVAGQGWTTPTACMKGVKTCERTCRRGDWNVALARVE